MGFPSLLPSSASPTAYYFLHLGTWRTQMDLERSTGSMCPWSREGKRPLPHCTCIHGDPVSFRLNSLSDAPNHCPITGLCWKTGCITSCLEFPGSLRLQRPVAGWTVNPRSRQRSGTDHQEHLDLTEGTATTSLTTFSHKAISTEGA